ncbi:hypothetical protein VSDG_05794 [Cytospora chrysosperma]|uniref:DUF7730 domain-containing protein n=1 Tax=Cytospora chrysosperma TaxID=252740 RepID=A0A423VVW6_CYTCH|nr:hypothetical protein VSDG_05794 [Valsa sordida]
MVRDRIPDTSHYRRRKHRLICSDAPSPFHFDRLPSEIRNMIYHLVVLDSKTSLVLELTSWCPHWSDTRYGEPHFCGLRLVEETIDAAGNTSISRSGLLDSTRNLNLLRASKWIWREAAPMLYGQNFKFLSTEALAQFLSRLRRETLGFIRHIDWLVCSCRDRTRRLHDVMHYLTQAPMLQRLIAGIPPEFYGQRRRPRSMNIFVNQIEFLHDWPRFNVQLGRYLAFCLYRNYYGMWMAFFDELDWLLSMRQQTEDMQQASDLPAGRRATRNSWKSVDFVAQAGHLPDFDLRVP